MKFNLYIKLVSTVLILVFFSAYAMAQVTVGSTAEPVKGALLDVKNIVPATGNTDPLKNETSTTGGIVLPRVKLEALNTLSPFVTNPNDPDVKRTHTGLIVYNVITDAAKSLEQGIYSWDGDKWNVLITGEIVSSPWFKIGTTSSSRNNTDDSYLSARTVVGGDAIASINNGESAALTVTGGDASINGIIIGKGKGNFTGNTAIGEYVLTNVTSGNNTAAGFMALAQLTSGSNNTSIGHLAGVSQETGNNNIAIGYGVLLPDSTGNNQINIGNTVIGIADALPKVGIGTDNPKATLHVAGDMKFTNASPISGGSVMLVDTLTGIVGKTLIAPRIFTSIEVVNANTQTVGTAINTSGNIIPVTWNASDFTQIDIAELRPASDNEIIFTKKESGMYEVSGYVSYNPDGTLPPGYPTNITLAQSGWLNVVNVMIQKYNTNSNSWETLTAAQASWSGVAIRNPKLINVPPTPVSLKENDRLRMVLQKPGSPGAAHGGNARIESIGSGLGFSKGFKIINL